MRVLQKAALFCAAGTLAACSSETAPFTPAISGSAQNIGGSYSVTQNGSTTVLGAPTGTSAGSGLEFWSSAPDKAYVFANADVIAIAGMNTTSNATFAGITGTAAASVPVSGSADYAGGFSATYYRGGSTNGAWNVSGAFATNVNFASGALVGTGTGQNNSELTVNGTVSGVNFNGTAQFSADDYTGLASSPMTGGFYGLNTLAGVYQGDAVAGVFYGQ